MPFPNHRSGGGSVPLTHGDSWQGLVSTEANLLHQRKPNKLQERRFQTSVKTYRHAARHILMCVVTGSNYSCEDGGLGGFSFGSLCVTTALLNTHFILINEITPSAPRKVKGHEATCVRTCLFLLKKKKKKVRNNTHPWKTLYCFTAQTVSNKAYFTKTHTKVDIIDLHTSILVIFVRPKHKNDLF